MSKVSRNLRQIQTQLKSGHLYIIVNDAFPGWVKVGTTTNLKERLHTYQTSDPFRRYRIVYSLEHPEFRTAERKIKETMKRFALSIRNEWYEVDLGVAKSRLEEQLEAYQGLHDEIKIS